jgi:glycosyltransferase involved in cell wall biosynthesis
MKVSDEEPRVTVIIPCYNVARFVGDALWSVATQTASCWKILAIDDGSTDDTLQVVTSYSKKIGDRMEVLSGPNQGACHARNMGIELATTEFVAFLDADDVWMREKIEYQLAEAENFPHAVGSTTSYVSVGGNLGPKEKIFHFGWKLSELKNWTLLGASAPALNSTLFVRRKDLVRIGSYDTDLVSYADDIDLAWRLLEIGEIRSVTIPLVTIRSSPLQIHHDKSRMEIALTKVYSKLSKRHADLATAALANLEIYLGLQRVFNGQVCDGLGRLVKTEFEFPFATLKFLVNRLLGTFPGASRF